MKPQGRIGAGHLGAGPLSLGAPASRSLSLLHFIALPYSCVIPAKDQLCPESRPIAE